MTFVDSTQPWIYLPSEACTAFERQFNLQYNSAVASYVVSDEQHDVLMASNPNITFTIADSKDGGPTVDIVLPYSSFDLELKPPLARENARYFPIAPAQNESQYTLGRTFLQEAYEVHPLSILCGILRRSRYLTVDYERSNFSISQCTFADGVQANIVPILSTDTKDRTAHNYSGIIGGTVGATVFILLNLVLLVVVRRKWKRQKINIKSGSSISSEPYTPRFATVASPPKEIGDNSLAAARNGYREMDDTAIFELAQLSRSMLQSHTDTDSSGLPAAASTAAISKLELPSPAAKTTKKGTRDNLKRDQHFRACRNSLSPMSNRSDSRLSLYDSPLPPTPRDSNVTILQIYTGYEERSNGLSGHLTSDNVKEWIRTGTPF